MQSDRPVLIFDGLNTFIRSYVAFPSMTSNGEQFGGVVGFLKTLRRIVSDTSPSMVYIAWEGGGSSKRRSLFKEYKLNRRPEKLNRFYEDDIPDSEENKKFQLLSLLALLKHVPVCQLYAANCEGDDVIAYLCEGDLKDKNKIIVSSDKDLYQLLDENTKLYSLHKKRFVTKESVAEDYRITSSNFAIAKALCGDASDNIPGIKGMGFKTVAKIFPFLGRDEKLILQDVFDYSASHVDESRYYKRVIDSWDDVKRNWKLVYLNGNMVPVNQAERIDRIVQNYVPKYNKIEFMKLLAQEGVNSFDINDFFYAFSCIEGFTH